MASTYTQAECVPVALIEVVLKNARLVPRLMWWVCQGGSEGLICSLYERPTMRRFEVQSGRACAGCSG